MKTISTLGLLLALCGASFAQGAPQSDEAQVLIEKSKAVIQSFKSKDAVTLNTLLADDFRIVSSDGKIYGRNEMLGAAQEGMLQDFMFYSPQAMAAGSDSAIVTYNVVLTMPEGDEPGMAPRYQKISDLWVREGTGGNWRLKFEQATPLRPID